MDRLFTTFNDSGVVWALLRGRSELATGRDVDLLVAAAHLRLAEEAIFGLGGAPLPQRRYPWHHMYVIDIPGAGPNLKLDLVTEVIYSRELRIGSDLERGCLERRVRDGALFLLSPTDAFWTILLHCVLDKRHVKQDRADELLARVDDLVRPSAGEEFFASLCPPDWSPDRAIDCVVRGDLEPLGRLGSEMLSRLLTQTSTLATSSPAEPVAFEQAPRRLIDKVRRRATDAATGAAYRKVWRGLGLGVVPHIFDLVEEARVDATVIELRRRPGRCDVVVAVADDQLPRLLPEMRGHYRPVAGAWRRVGNVGLESVRLLPTSELSLTERPPGEPHEASLLLPDRGHLRMALSWPSQDGRATRR